MIVMHKDEAIIQSVDCTIKSSACLSKRTPPSQMRSFWTSFSFSSPRIPLEHCLPSLARLCEMSFNFVDFMICGFGAMTSNASGKRSVEQ